MTLAKRILPCLDVDGGRVVKGTRFVDLVANVYFRIIGPGCKTEHQRRWEWPRLRRMIVTVDNAHAGFLKHFAAHGILQCFSGFDESSQGGIAPCRPG